MGEVRKKTPFSVVYDSFLSRVTSDMYMEWSAEDTYKALQDLLINAIPRFEFPRVNIFDYELGELETVEDATEDEYGNIVKPATYEWVGGFFRTGLTNEEVNILSLSMVIEWLGQQLVTTDLARMKYSGSDFKFSSQANHMAKLKELIEYYKRDNLHLQRLYKRRKLSNEGEIRSTAGQIMTTPNYGYKID